MRNFIVLSLLLFCFISNAQQVESGILTIDRIFNSNEFKIDRFMQARWIENGNAYTTLEPSEEYKGAKDLISYETLSGEKSTLINAARLIPKGTETPLRIANYSWSIDKKQLLIFTNTKRVWRQNTKGDYWLLDRPSGRLHQVGASLPESSLMFAKFSPDCSQIAYVSEHNLFVEDISTRTITQLTKDGSTTLINGTFDWAYEEEFGCRDGFRWSSDGKHLAFWQIDAKGIRNFLMINNTDSVYAHTIPVQYPKVGETPSSCRIGVVSIEGGKTQWMNIPGDNQQHYLPRLKWTEDNKNLLVLQLNRKQNTAKLWKCDKNTGNSNNIYTERDAAWIDAIEEDDWLWLNNGKSFTWISEEDGWKHLYSISENGEGKTLISQGNYDVISVVEIDQKGGWVYFIASPENATQRYLYQLPLYKSGTAKRLSPMNQEGSHSYQIAPGGNYAFHTFSNTNTPPTTELISLPDHEPLRSLINNENYINKITTLERSPIEFFQVTTEDKITMDGYMIKPPDFDSNTKYPVLFYVYGEPAGQTARDRWNSNLWHTMLSQKGYIIITLDNRGTPSPKGREWRKSIYRKVGVINSRDQAMAAKEIQKWDFVDPDRIGVWGWSGGGSMTLNLLFRYPEIYKTGLSVAPVANQLYYDNIYQERYMGVPWENEADFLEGSPITYAKNLEGNLLLIHGTGDDNVHYQNAEALINELIKHNKLFQIMPYPNRSHGIYEGENTTRHLYTLMTDFLLKNLERGGK